MVAPTTVRTAPGEIYTFELRKDPATGKYVGEIRDDWGWVISLQGEVTADRKMVRGTGTLEPLHGLWQEVS